MPEPESKHDRFVRVFEPRMNRCLNELRKLGAGASANYEAAPSDVDAMIGTLRGEIDRLEGAYRKTKVEATGFGFKSIVPTAADLPPIGNVE